MYTDILLDWFSRSKNICKGKIYNEQFVSKRIIAVEGGDGTVG